MKKLTIDNIDVPEGMVTATGSCFGAELVSRIFIRRAIAAALLWLAENPIVPSDAECREMENAVDFSELGGYFSKKHAQQWQRRMFLKRKPELPSEVLQAIEDCDTSQPWTDELHKLAAKAYEIGKQARNG